MKTSYLLIFIITCSLFCCREEDDPNTAITLQFAHVIDQQPIEYNNLKYVNAASNEYEVREIQWFISDLVFVKNNNETINPKPGFFYHYIDTNIPSTFTSILSTIPVGEYKSLRFTFGLKEANNKPGQFTNPPESNMEWPFTLGGDFGGYHYMKLNGFWMNTSQQRTPFNFHIGVGQTYNDNNEITGYVQNWFEVELPLNVFIEKEKNNTLEIVMNVESWFETPHIYDHNEFGGKIMKNQTALQQIRENGYDVFSLNIK